MMLYIKQTYKNTFFFEMLFFWKKLNVEED